MDTRLFRQRKHLSSAIGTQVPRFPDPLSHSVFALASRAASLALASSVVSIGAGLTCSSPAFATTYIVDTTGDPGPAGTLSLRQAILSASYYTGDTIQFAPALNGSTITLQAGQLVIPSSMTIQGPGAGKLTISGNNANPSRIFEIYTLGASPLAVTISGLTLTGGNTGANGGAIYAENISLNLQNVVLSGNTVRPVTVAMFNFVSVEQTLWAKLAAVSVLAMLPVVILGIIAQKNIVKGLTVGAVKGGGRR